MKTTLEIQNLFYRNLGNLFYAIAASDKTVREEEINTLKQIVNTEWLILDGVKDKSEVDAMRQIKSTFNQLTKQTQHASDCMTDFKSFKKAHEYLFTDNVKKLIWKTANAIASSFSRRNKSELILLTELGNILDSQHK